MVEHLIVLFDRDLDRLVNEISLFKKEENLWLVKGRILNAAGNLCLHLVGNLNTYIGKNLDNTGYVRNRDAEFSSKNVSQRELLNQIQKTKEVVGNSLRNFRENQLSEIYPEHALGYEMTNSYFLIHLSGHLNYHLGQINYIRRMLED